MNIDDYRRRSDFFWLLFAGGLLVCMFAVAAAPKLDYYPRPKTAEGPGGYLDSGYTQRLNEMQTATPKRWK